MYVITLFFPEWICGFERPKLGSVKAEAVTDQENEVASPENRNCANTVLDDQANCAPIDAGDFDRVLCDFGLF